MKKLIYLFLPLLAAPAFAQQQPYESNGPNGGQARMFVQKNGALYVAARGGLYQRIDSAWTLPTMTSNDLSCQLVSGIFIGNTQDVLAGTERGEVYFSSNAGANWTNVTSNLRPGSAYNSVLLAGPNYLAVHADSGFLFMSNNAGLTWMQNPTIGTARAGYLIERRNEIYLTSSAGLLRSMSQGLSFMPLNSDPSLNGRITWVADTLWVSGSNGVRMSLDNGMTFAPPLLPGRAVGAFSVNGTNILAAVRGTTGVDTLLHSADGGNSFSPVTMAPALRFARVHDIIAEQNFFLVGTDQGILRGNANNTGWTVDDSTFRARHITQLGTSQNAVLATADGDGVFRTTDSGASWALNLSAFNGASNTIRATDGYNQYVYAAGESNFYRSTDGGASYTAGATGLTPGMYTSVHVNKANGEVIVAREGEVYRSTDNGGSFSMLTTGIPTGTARRIYRADTSWFVASSNDNLYQAGSNLQFSMATGIASMPTGVTHNGRAYFASTRYQSLFTSMDGRSWSVVSTSGNIPSNLYAITTLDTAVYVGTDNGLLSNASGTWQADSLQGHTVYALTTHNRKLYAGTCDGVWTRRNLPTPVDSSVSVPGSQSGLTSLQLSPNPTTGDFQAAFDSRSGGAASLILTDLAGRAVYVSEAAIQAGRNKLTVPVSSLGLSAGMYFLKVRIGDQQGIQRLLIRSN